MDPQLFDGRVRRESQSDLSARSTSIYEIHMQIAKLKSVEILTVADGITVEFAYFTVGVTTIATDELNK